jgi:DNA-binding response OmpR family regulator
VTRNPSILVLDDDDNVRDTIANVLIDAGFTVFTAADGLEAVALIDEQSFDLVVVDVKLPGGLNGMQVVRRARERHPALKCLFISGAHEPAVCDPELDDFVSKPFRPSLLLGCVWKVLRGNRPYPRVAIAR